MKGTDVDNVNQDLLVAVLAILTRRRSSPALAEALKAWTNRKGAASGFVAQGIGRARDHAYMRLNVLHSLIWKRTRTTCARAWIRGMLRTDTGVLTEIDDDGLRTTLGASLESNATLPLDGGSQARPASRS